jgi:hypothetical protein
MISARRITAWSPVLVFAVGLVAAPQGAGDGTGHTGGRVVRLGGTDGVNNVGCRRRWLGAFCAQVRVTGGAPRDIASQTQGVLCTVETVLWNFSPVFFGSLQKEHATATVVPDRSAAPDESAVPDNPGT